MGVRVGSDRYGEDMVVEHVAPNPAEKLKPVVADRDLLIERPDLGAGFHTQIRKGDEIPHGLRKFPRRSPSSRAVGGTTRKAAVRKRSQPKRRKA